VRAATWILVLILAAGCASHAGKREAKRESPRRAHPPPAVRAYPAERPPRAPKPKRAKPHTAKPKPQKKQAAKVRPRQRPQRALPWRLDGMSRVVHVRVRRIAIYKSPRAKNPLLRLAKRDGRGTQRAFLVRRAWRDWVQVYLPTRPNGSLGWVKRHAVRMYTNEYRLVVRLRSHKLHLWRGHDLIATYPVAVGTRSTPTPRGVFYVVELLQPPNPGGSYGPYSFGISAHSNVLKQFAGGDGRVGLHGTNEPGLIGSDVSHGCIRMRNGPIRRLAKILPLGTPVFVRS
jgi:hypothetical protein